MVNVSSKEELDTRSMQVQRALSSYHITTGTHMQTATFSRRRRAHIMSSGRARARLRSSERACFDMPSTMVDHSKNGDARRKSALSCKLSSSRVRTQIGVRTFLIGYPSFSPTPCPFAFPFGRGHSPLSGACPRPGAKANGQGVGENEGHPIKRARLREDSGEKFLSHPL